MNALAWGLLITCSDDGAAAFDEQDVAPSAMVLANAFSGADDPEAGGLVEVKARAVLREDPRLDGPDASGFGRGDEGIQEQPPDALATAVGMNIDGVLNYSGVDGPGGYRRSGDPAEDAGLIEGDVAVCGEPSGIEGVPVRGAGLESGVASIDPGLVDGQHGAGVHRGHGGDLHALAAVPGELPGVAEDGAQGLERIRDQRVVGPHAALVAGQDSGLDQDLQVVGDGGLG